MTLLELARPAWFPRRQEAVAEKTIEPPLPELAQVLNQAALTLAQEKRQAIIHTPNGPAFSPTALTSSQFFDHDLELTRTFTRGRFSRTSLAAEGRKLVQYAVDAIHQKGTTNWNTLISQIDQLETAADPLLKVLRLELEFGRILAQSPELAENPQTFLAAIKDHFLANEASLVSRNRKGNRALSQQGKDSLHATYNWQRRLFGGNDAPTYQFLKTGIATVFSGSGVEKLAQASLLGKLRWEETLTAYQILEQQLPEDLKIRGDEPLKGAALIQNRLKQALTRLEAELGYKVDAGEVINRYETELARAAELEEQEIAADAAALAALPKWRQLWVKFNPVKSLKRFAYGIFSGLAISTMLANPMIAFAKGVEGSNLPRDHSQANPDGDVQPDGAGRAIDHVARIETPASTMTQQPSALIHEMQGTLRAGPESTRSETSLAQIHQFHQALTSDQAQIVIHGGPHLNDLDPDDQVFRASLTLAARIDGKAQYPDRPADSLNVHPVDERVVNPAATPTTQPIPVTGIQVQGAENTPTLLSTPETGTLGNVFVIPIENLVEFQANPKYLGIVTLSADRALQVGDSVTVTTPQGDLPMEVVAKTTQAPEGSLNEVLWPLRLDVTKLTLVITNCGRPEVVGDRLTNIDVSRVIVVLQPKN
jgi:hypothetical protein